MCTRYTNTIRFDDIFSSKWPLVHLDDPALAQGHSTVQAGRQIHVVGGDNGGKTGRPHELRQRVENMLRGMDIEIPGKLVSQQDARGIGDSPRDRDTLLLATRQLRRPVI